MSSTTDYLSNALNNVNTSTAAARTASTKNRVTHDEFLQLLVMQLTHQDPLKPMEDIDFMGQMAQMQALDEQIAMTKTMTNMRIDTQIQSTSALIGKYISTPDPKDGSQSIVGLVERVVVEDDTVYAQLESGVRVAADDIKQVWNQSDTLRNDLNGAQAMIGSWVVALDSDYVTHEGLVLKATIDSKGDIWLKLHDGKSVRYNDVYEVSAWDVDDGSSTGTDEGADASGGDASGDAA